MKRLNNHNKTGSDTGVYFDQGHQMVFPHWHQIPNTDIEQSKGRKVCSFLLNHHQFWAERCRGDVFSQLHNETRAFMCIVWRVLSFMFIPVEVLDLFQWVARWLQSHSNGDSAQSSPENISDIQFKHFEIFEIIYSFGEIHFDMRIYIQVVMVIIVVKAMSRGTQKLNESLAN